MITRVEIEELYKEFKGDRDLIVAAMFERYPDLAGLNTFHNRPVVEVLLDDLESYSWLDDA